MIAHAVFDAHAIWSRWSFDPFEFVPAFVALGLYGVGLYATGVRAVSRARAACFAAGVAIGLGAVVSPLHAAAEAMFSMHMVQHQILMLIAAPLIVAGRPGLVMGLALPLRWRRWTLRIGRTTAARSVLRVLRNLLFVILVYAGVLWMWHLPGPYQAAVRSDTVHGLEHLSFFAISLAFWAGVVRTGPRRRMRYLPAIALVLGTMMLTGWLAAVLTFGGLVYPLYAQRAALLGLNASVDQQLAGSIMWVPSTLLYFVVFAVLFVRWFKELDARYAPTPVAEP